MTDVPGGNERAILAEGGPDLAAGRALPAEGRQAPGPHDAAPGQSSPGRPRRAGEASRPAAGVLADRIAAALVHHEPGWRLPRHTALARRYNVSTAEIDAAIDELAARRLIRRLPDGQLYRASPAEYLIPLEGVPGLASHVDPMGEELSCRSRQVSWRRVPEDIGWALRIPPSEPICVVRGLWTASGEPAAFTTTYLTADVAGPFTAAYDAQGGQAGHAAGTPDGLNLLPLAARPEEPGEERADLVPSGRPAALHVEMQPPPPSVARSLRLSAGQPAAMVTVRFDDLKAVRPIALTVAVVRADLFRIVVESGEAPLPGGQRSSSGAWTDAVEGWDPP
jgi:hypothetical protein